MELKTTLFFLSAPLRRKWIIVTYDRALILIMLNIFFQQQTIKTMIMFCTGLIGSEWCELNCSRLKKKKKKIVGPHAKLNRYQTRFEFQCCIESLIDAQVSTLTTNSFVRELLDQPGSSDVNSWDQQSNLTLPIYHPLKSSQVVFSTFSINFALV